MSTLALALVAFPVSVAVAIRVVLHARPEATLTDAAVALATAMRAILRRGP